MKVEYVQCDICKCKLVSAETSKVGLFNGNLRAKFRVEFIKPKGTKVWELCQRCFRKVTLEAYNLRINKGGKKK